MWSRRGLESAAQTLGQSARHQTTQNLSDHDAAHTTRSLPQCRLPTHAQGPRDHFWDLRSGELLCQLAEQLAVLRIAHQREKVAAGDPRKTCRRTFLGLPQIVPEQTR